MNSQQGRNNKLVLLLRIFLFLLIVGFIGFLFALEGGMPTRKIFLWGYQPKLFAEKTDSVKSKKTAPIPKITIPWNPDLKIYGGGDIKYDRDRKIEVHITSKQPFTGRYRKYNGNKEIEYKDGKYHGIYKQNYHDGHLRRLRWYEEAVEQRSQVFHTNGNLWQDVNYKDLEIQFRGKQRTVRLADFKIFYQNGSLHSSGSKIGRYARHGLIKRYRKDGILFSETVWKNGRLVENKKIKASDASLPPIITNSIGMEFVLIPSGSFTMGDDKGHEFERPAHTVSIKNSFYLSKYELTVGQLYKLFNIRSENEAHNLPAVDQMGARDVVGYLNIIESCEECYRLPTEAEWEYAARAGTTGKYYWGNEMNGDYAWYSENSEQKRQPVGLKKPNNWGLYDMIGNVWELTARRPTSQKRLEQELTLGYSRSSNLQYLSKISLDVKEYRRLTAMVRRGGSFGTRADHSTVSRRYKSINLGAGYRRTGLRLLLTTDYK